MKTAQSTRSQKSENPMNEKTLKTIIKIAFNDGCLYTREILDTKPDFMAWSYGPSDNQKYHERLDELMQTIKGVINDSNN